MFSFLNKKAFQRPTACLPIDVWATSEKVWADLRVGQLGMRGPQVNEFEHNCSGHMAPSLCEQTDRETHMTENISFLHSLGDDNESFNKN